MICRTPQFRGPCAQRGAIAPSRLIALAVIVVVLAAAGWWFFQRTPGTAVLPGTTTAPNAAAPTASPAAPAATVSDELTVDQLYREARKAMTDNRIATPAGNNALEYYLKILAKQPDDSGPKDALRELFPFATGAAEDQINQNNFDEANRIVGLLAQADPNNYSLTILRSKLDAKKKQNDREQAATAAAAARPQTPGATPTQPGATAATTPGTTPAGEAPAATTETPSATPAAPTSTPSDTATASTTPAAPPPRATPTPAPPPAATGETRDVAVTAPPVPVYPIEAARARKEGWVEVEFTVAPDGSVQNAHVTNSLPQRIFDKEAIAAVQRAKFEPKMQNGTPVASTLRRRIEFKLGQ